MPAGLGTVIASFSDVIDSGTLLQGRFLIGDQIGKGGMGAVYRAIDQKFGSQVAIKETFYGDLNLGEAFEREARLLNGLHHPILPHVSDYFTENGGHFLVMEYIDGEDLSELLKRGEVFHLGSVVEWALDILDGLDYLHSQDPPVIHRDIKPNNLKITPRGKIVLLDFGMAKETSSNTLGARSVFGYSRRYSPLEQIEGSGTDTRSDIFALGATLYHLLTGQPPVDVLARASAIVAGRPDPLLPVNSVNPEVPESVAVVISSALALNPENRFESARAMSGALERAINTSGVRDALAADVGPQPLPEQPRGTDAVNAAALFSAGEVATSEGYSQNEIKAPSVSRVIKEDDVVVPLPVVDPARTPTFNARNELSRRLSSMLPDSIPAVRIRRPSRLSPAVWVPIVLLCLGLVLVGTFAGVRGDESTAAAESQVVDNDSVVETPEASAPEPVQPETGVQSHAVEPTPSVTAEDSLDLSNGAIATRGVTTRATSQESAQNTKVPDARVDRRVQSKRDVTERPRRVVKPAFEQPSVSSIEAIMTGVPDERRRRWQDDLLTEDEIRRRQRRLRREQRRLQQPF